MCTFISEILLLYYIFKARTFTIAVFRLIIKLEASVPYKKCYSVYYNK